MRRIFVFVLVAALMCTAVACGAEPAPEESRGNSADLYGTWTKSDWESASPEQKQLAVIFLVEEGAASMGDDEEVVQSVIEDAEETLTAEQYEDIENAITNYFDTAKDGATLQSSLNDVLKTISKYVAIG